ncbi:hypothetical protein Si079_01011 [Streptococcus infantarius subsp. infantarius]|nr:hypothetical protein [Streptococcus infantarius subsp. infantarius]
MTSEVWKPIKGYEGFYEVSNKGNVRSVERFDRIGRRRKSELISVNSVQQLGLYHDGKRKNLSVKNLVADAFLEAPQADEKLIHVDGNPKNNCVENLMWQKKAQRKRNVYRFEDNKTGEIFEGSIGDCCDAWGLTKSALLNRANKGRVTKTFVSVQGLHTFTNIETGEKLHGTKQQAREYFHISWSTLYDKIDSGLIQMFPPDDEPMNSEDKISDPKTKRLLNQYYKNIANELGLWVEE